MVSAWSTLLFFFVGFGCRDRYSRRSKEGVFELGRDSGSDPITGTNDTVSD